MKPYIVHIPTRGKDRRDVLVACIQAFSFQTHPPKEIIIIDNNDERGTLDDFEDHFTGVVPCEFPVPGIIHGDQTGLNWVNKFGYEIAARWDDDLIPAPDCMEKLVRLHDNPGVVCSGGMYPATNNEHPIFGNNLFSRRLCNGTVRSGHENNKHVQFFPWWGRYEIIRRHFLYSSFVYNVKAANDIGGFCTDYSQHSYRADTDFTMRMGVVGELMLDTSAIAEHRLQGGGTRDIVGDEKQRMQWADVQLFQRRMRERGMDPDYGTQGIIDVRESFLSNNQNEKV